MDAMLLPTDAELEEFASDWLKENFLVSLPSPIATTMITFCKAVLLEFGNRPVEEAVSTGIGSSTTHWLISSIPSDQKNPSRR